MAMASIANRPQFRVSLENGINAVSRGEGLSVKQIFGLYYSLFPTPYSLFSYSSGFHT